MQIYASKADKQKRSWDGNSLKKCTNGTAINTVIAHCMKCHTSIFPIALGSLTKNKIKFGPDFFSLLNLSDTQCLNIISFEIHAHRKS